MHHCALQHSAWHEICMGLMRLSGMNVAGVGGDVGASEAYQRCFQATQKNLSCPAFRLKNTIDPTLASGIV
jgi:hypothetical protein